MPFIKTSSDTYPGPSTRAAISSNKDDMTLTQYGGEGGGKSGDVPGKNADIAFTPGVTPSEKYTGPGRNLKTESF